MNKSNKTCIICNYTSSASDSVEFKVVNKSISVLLADILEEPSDGLFCKLLCTPCFTSSMEYNEIKFKLQKIKKDFKTNYKKAVKARENVPKTVESPNKVKKLVLPASKLKPLPSDYIINVGNLAVSPEKTGAKAKPNLNSTTKPTFDVPILNKVLKTAAKTPNISPTKVNIAASNIAISNKKTNIATSNIAISNAGNIVNSPESRTRDVLFIGNEQMVKKEIEDDENDDEEQNNDENSMEIDEDCTLVRVVTEDNGNMLDENSADKETENEKEEYFDVSILENEEGAILGKLEIMDDEDDGEHAFVMSDADGSILRVMSGQKLVYRNGEITLVPDDGRGTAGDDKDQSDDDGQDSNDESQIELQVSGDEETANAIIAAAQEQGGAFIKVDSGEMFRVKSVQSTSTRTIERNIKVTEPIIPAVNVAEWTDGEFRCTVCLNGDKEATPFTSPHAKEMMTHLKEKHNARIYICELCRAFLRRRVDYNQHMAQCYSKQSHEGKKIIKIEPKATNKVHSCGVCGKRFSSRALLAEHGNSHSGARPFVCGSCGKGFASKYTLQAHIKTHTERPRPFSCDQCPKTFFTQQNLIQHEKTHLGIKDFVCNICGKGFGTQHNLEVHGVVHSGKRPFGCGVCGKAFARRAEINDHMRIHTGERPFACNICGARFAQRSNLHSHTRVTHLGDARHACPHCPKRFKRRRLLDYHIKALHTGERPLSCEVCHATFVYPEHYKKHARIHSGEKPFVCEVCGKSFNSRDNRNMHRFVHSDKKPYECLVCGQGYMRKQLLYQHMTASNHLAESIVVNQPRVQRVLDSGTSATQLTDKIESDDGNNLATIEKINLILESQTSEEMEAAKAIAENNEAAKSIIPEEKKLVLADGSKSATVSLAAESDEQSIFTILQHLDDATKSDILNTDQLGQQVQMVTSDENGAIRVLQFHVSRPPQEYTLH